MLNISRQAMFLIISFANILTLGAPTAIAADFRSELAEHLRSRQGHTVAVAVVKGQELRFLDSVTSFGTQPAAPAVDAITRIASVSKIMIAIAAHQVFLEQAIPLSTPINEFGLDLPITNPFASTDPVRLIHLLEHTTGIQETTARWQGADATYPNQLKVLQNWFHHPVVRWPPGEFPTYSNWNYVAIVAILEHLTQLNFDAIMTRYITKPLGMVNTTFRFQPAEMPLLLPGYHPGTNEILPNWDGPYRATAGGFSSARDLSRLLLALLNKGQLDGQKVFDPSIPGKLQRPTSSLAARLDFPSGHGPGSVARMTGRRTYAGHNGYIEGYTARLYYSLQRNEGYAILTNTHSLHAGPSLGKIGSMIERHFFPRREPTAATPPSVAAESGSAGPHPTLRAGFYQFINPRFLWTEPFNIIQESFWLRSRDDGKLEQTKIFGETKLFTALGAGQWRQTGKHGAHLQIGEKPDGTPFVFMPTNKHFELRSGWPIYGLMLALFLGALSFLGGLPWAVYQGFWRRSPAKSWLFAGLASSSLYLFALGALQLKTSYDATSVNYATLSLTGLSYSFLLFPLLGAGVSTYQWRGPPQNSDFRWQLFICLAQLCFIVPLVPYGWLGFRMY